MAECPAPALPSARYRETLSAEERMRIDLLLASRMRRGDKGCLAPLPRAHRFNPPPQDAGEGDAPNPFATPRLTGCLADPPARLPPVRIIMREHAAMVQRQAESAKRKSVRAPPPPAHEALSAAIDPRRRSSEEERGFDLRCAVRELMSEEYWHPRKPYRRPRFWVYVFVGWVCKRAVRRLRQRQVQRLFRILSADTLQDRTALHYSCPLGKGRVQMKKAARLWDGFRALVEDGCEEVSMRRFDAAAGAVAAQYPIGPTFFRRLDKDRSGALSYYELLRAAFPMSEKHTLRAVHRAVVDPGRFISARSSVEQRYNAADLRDAVALFRHFTRDGAVRLTFARFKQCAPRDLTDDELAAQFAEADGNGDGEVDFNEFAEWHRTGWDDVDGCDEVRSP
eukprot:TRINITY_DN5441_c0_g4_i1.p1 TRINITY_DN5441_c0_g4~~TRINITY_DN5441_c0_g4_i1.p1  ORF type:complete len:424 (+),score=135.24 TRINITY_DN5441_c0_g4_i1:89-1273(+)